jgi:hypothetical protein
VYLTRDRGTAHNELSELRRRMGVVCRSVVDHPVPGGHFTVFNNREYRSIPQYISRSYIMVIWCGLLTRVPMAM